MQAIREVRNIVSQELILQLPQEFLEKQVEIIILPLDDVTYQDKNDNLENELEALSWKMGERLYASRDQLYER